MIEQLEVDGKAATVIYFDEKWVPVAKTEAVLAKVLFDDGKISFVVLDGKSGRAES